MKSEHRRLRQSSRHTPSSVDTRNSKLSPSRSVLPRSRSGNSELTRSRSGNSDITRSRSGNSEITTRSGNSEITRSRSGNSEITRTRSQTSDSLQENRSAHPNIVTIEAEVHEDCVPITLQIGQRNTVKNGRDNGKRETDKEELAHLLVETSDRVKGKPAGDSESSRNLSLDLESTKWADKGSHRAEECTETEPDSKQGTLSLASEGALTLEYRRELEAAFVTNHLYGNTPQSIAEAARTITLQAQVCTHL